MKYYPINLDIKNKNCLVVGGGSVGARKTSTLIKCGAATTVISPEFIPEFENIQRRGATLLKKKYSDNDLEKMFLVIGATDNPELNQKISRQAKEKGILCNIADLPDKSDFILPSIIDRDDLLITISTSGKSPALAKKIRMELDQEFGDEYTAFIILMGRIRNKLLSQNHDPDEHKKIFKNLVNSELIHTIKDKDNTKTNDLLHKILGNDYTYENLLAGDVK